MQVSWSGVPNPTAADAVALVIATSYAPDCDLHKTVPLKYRWALQTNPDYLSTGSGSTTSALPLLCSCSRSTGSAT